MALTVEKNIKDFCAWARIRAIDLANASGLTRQNINWHSREGSKTIVVCEKGTENFDIKNGGKTIASGQIKRMEIIKRGKMEIPFVDFAKYMGIQKNEFMEAAGLGKYNHKHLAESTAKIVVRYNSVTGEFKIVRPEEIKGSGKIKIKGV